MALLQGACVYACQEFVSLLERLIWPGPRLIVKCATLSYVINQLCTGIMGRYEAK